MLLLAALAVSACGGGGGGGGGISGTPAGSYTLLVTGTTPAAPSLQNPVGLNLIVQ